MCGRFTQTTTWEKAKKESAAKTPESDSFQPCYNIAPMQIVPVVRDAESERIISTLK
jgi:putative SOS response-associated peptidase YedK